LRGSGFGRQVSGWLQWHNGDQEIESWQMGRLIDEQPMGGGVGPELG